MGLPVISNGSLARPSTDSQQGRRCRRFAEEVADGAFPWDIQVYLVGESYFTLCLGVAASPDALDCVSGAAATRARIVPNAASKKICKLQATIGRYSTLKDPSTSIPRAADERNTTLFAVNDMRASGMKKKRAMQVRVSA